MRDTKPISTSWATSLSHLVDSSEAAEQQPMSMHPIAIQPMAFSDSSEWRSGRTAWLGGSRRGLGRRGSFGRRGRGWGRTALGRFFGVQLGGNLRKLCAKAQQSFQWVFRGASLSVEQYRTARIRFVDGISPCRSLANACLNELSDVARAIWACSASKPISTSCFTRC